MHKRLVLVKMLLFIKFQYCTLMIAFLLAGKFVAIHGTVVRVSNVKPLVMGMAFSCNLCGETQVWYTCWTLISFCYFGMKMLILFTKNEWILFQLQNTVLMQFTIHKIKLRMTTSHLGDNRELKQPRWQWKMMTNFCDYCFFLSSFIVDRTCCEWTVEAMLK